MWLVRTEYAPPTRNYLSPPRVREGMAFCESTTCARAVRNEDRRERLGNLTKLDIAAAVQMAGEKPGGLLRVRR